MKLSIITTVYQAEKDLPRLLDSMLAQKSPELEFFLIDNGCTDGSAKICAEYASRDPRFKIHTLEKNIGYIAARNLGIDIVEADYIGFCDSDDYLEPNGYDRAIEKIKETECDIYLTAYRTIFQNHTVTYNLPFTPGLYVEKEISSQLLPLAFGPIDERGMLYGFMWKEVFRLRLLKENGLKFDKTIQPYEDVLQNVRAFKLCNSIFVDKNPIYNYIVNEHSITASYEKTIDVAERWARIVSFYEQKKAEAISAECQSANLNDSYRLLNTLIILIAQYSQCPTKDFSIIKESEYLKTFLSAPQAKNEIKGRFFAFCLKYNLINFLFLILKAKYKR